MPLDLGTRHADQVYSSAGTMTLFRKTKPAVTADEDYVTSGSCSGGICEAYLPHALVVFRFHCCFCFLNFTDDVFDDAYQKALFLWDYLLSLFIYYYYYFVLQTFLLHNRNSCSKLTGQCPVVITIVGELYNMHPVIDYVESII